MTETPEDTATHGDSVDRDEHDTNTIDVGEKQRLIAEALTNKLFTPITHEKGKVVQLTAEARFWVTTNFLLCIASGLGVKTAAIEWASLYVLADLTNKLIHYPVLAARNLFGEETGTEPAICPILDLPTIIHNLRSHDSAIKTPSGNLRHNLSVTEFCRTLNCPILCHSVNDKLVLDILKPAHATSQALVTIQDIAEASIDSVHVEVYEPIDHIIARITIDKANTFLTNGAVYIRSRSTDTYKPPISTLTLPVNIGHSTLVLQMGFPEGTDVIQMIQPVFPALVPAFNLIEKTLERAYTFGERVSSRVKNILNTLAIALKHDAKNALSAPTSGAEAANMILGFLQNILRQFSEGGLIFSQFVERYKLGPYDSLNALLDAIDAVRLQLDTAPGNRDKVLWILDIMCGLAVNAFEMTKIKSTSIIRAIESELKFTTFASFLGLKGKDRDKVKVVTLNETDQEIPMALEFAGAIAICIRNLVSNSVEVFKSEKLIKSRDLDIIILITTCTIKGTVYYRISVLDNCGGIDPDKILLLQNPLTQELDSTKGGSGVGLVALRNLSWELAPDVEPNQAFQINQGIPDFLEGYDFGKVHYDTCISFLVPAAITNP